MNPKKCAFGVSAGQFLGFLVHERGIEIGLKSQEAVRNMVHPPPRRSSSNLLARLTSSGGLFLIYLGELNPL
jgi:hypothetical protein